MIDWGLIEIYENWLVAGGVLVMIWNTITLTLILKTLKKAHKP